MPPNQVCGNAHNARPKPYAKVVLPMRFELMISRLLSERLSQLGQGSPRNRHYGH